MPKGFRKNGTKLGFQKGRNHYNWKGGEIKLICKTCGKEFWERFCCRNRAKFCSRKCKRHSEEAKQKMRKSRKGKYEGIKNYFYGKKHTKESKEKMRKVARERIVSEETKKKHREWSINNPNRKFKNTMIEILIENELKRRDIYYQKQVPLCKIAIVDFYLPKYHIVIQCDGDYWHNKMGAKERDERQNTVLTSNGFNVYRFWEHEINKSSKNCIDRIFLNKLNSISTQNLLHPIR